MGLEIRIKCPLCKAQIPSDALRCSHCAGNLDEKDLQEKMKKQTLIKKITISVVAVILIIFFISVLGGSNSSPSSSIAVEQNSTSESMAYIQSQGYVEKVLKSPSSADFPFADYEYKDYGDNTYLIKSYVDSQNSFGAMIRSDYIATLKYLGGNDADPSNWQLERLTFDGELIYDKEVKE